MRGASLSSVSRAHVSPTSEWAASFLRFRTSVARSPSCACGGFVGHVKLMFIRGTEIKPEPPVTPIGMGKATRGVEPTSVDDLDERQAASWMKQAAAMPFFGGRSNHEEGRPRRRSSARCWSCSRPGIGRLRWAYT